MIRKHIPAAFCMTALLITAGCSGPSDTSAAPAAAAQEEAPAPENEISVRMDEQYSQWTNSNNAVVMVSAEMDGVEVKNLHINGGDCSIVSKQHRPLLNVGQQNTYTISPLCPFNTIRRIEVGTSRGTTTFTF
jgi:hypothetical protein